MSRKKTALAVPDFVPTQIIQAELDAEAPTVAELCQLAPTFEIDTPDDLDMAGDFLHTLVDAWKRLEERRTSVTKPLLEAKRAHDALFSPVQSRLKEAEKTLRGKVAAYSLACSEAQVAAMQQVGAGVPGAELLVPTEPPNGVSVKAVWDFEVIDPNLVPRRFLCVDERALKEHVAFADTERTPPRDVPGVRFFKRGKVTVRS